MVGFSNNAGFYYPINKVRYVKNGNARDAIDTIIIDNNTDLYLYVNLKYLSSYEELYNFKLNINYEMYNSTSVILKLKSFNYYSEETSEVNFNTQDKGNIDLPHKQLTIYQSQNNINIDLSNYVKQLLSESNNGQIRIRFRVESSSNAFLLVKNVNNILEGAFIKKHPLIQTAKIYDDESMYIDYTNSKMLFNLKSLDCKYKGISLVNNGYLLFDSDLSLITQSLLNFSFKFDFSNISNERIIMFDNFNNVVLFYPVDRENNLYKCFENNYYIIYSPTESTIVLNINGVNYYINKNNFQLNLINKDNITLSCVYDQNKLVKINHQISETNIKNIVSIVYNNDNVATIKYPLNNKEIWFGYENDKLKSYYIYDTKNTTEEKICLYVQLFTFINNKLDIICYDYINAYCLSKVPIQSIQYLAIEDQNTLNKLYYGLNLNSLEIKDNYGNITKNYLDNKNNIILSENYNHNNLLLDQNIYTNLNKGNLTKNLKCINLFDEEIFKNNITNTQLTPYQISDNLFTSSLSNQGFKFSQISQINERIITYPLNIKGMSDEMLSLSCLGKINLFDDSEYLEIGLKIYYDGKNNTEELYSSINFDKENNDYQFVEIHVPTINTYSKIDFIIKYYGHNEATLSNIFINKIKNEGNLIYNENNEIVGISDNNTVVSSVYKKSGNDDIYITKTDNGQINEQKLSSGNIIYSENYCNNDKTNYEYDNQDNILSRKIIVQDNFKSEESYIYDNNDELRSKTIDNKTEYYYNTNINQLSLKQTICHNGMLNKQVTDYSSVDKKFTQIFSLNDLEEQNKFYYQYGLLFKIEHQGNKIYQFNYDDKNRIKTIYFDGIKYIEYEYDENTNEQINQKKYQNDNYYKFDYDNYGRLRHVFHNSYTNAILPIFSYEYDSYNRISCIKNMDDEIEYYYEYDDLNNVIKEDNKEIEITNQYYKNNIVSKNNKIKNENKITHYSYSSYMNVIDNVFSQITNNIYCDYLYPNKNQSFIYSDKFYFTNELIYDEDLKRNVYKFSNVLKPLKFTLTEINKRLDNNVYRNKTFKYKDYNTNINQNINILSFVKPSSIGTIRQLFEFKKNSDEISSNSYSITLEVLSSSVLYVKEYTNDILTEENRVNLSINLDKWNIIGLSCEYNYDNNLDKISIIINDEIHSVYTVHHGLYDSVEILDTHTNNLNMAFLSVGSRNINLEEQKFLYQDFDKIFNKKQTNKNYNVTNYEVFDTNDLDKLTFNNSFESIKANKPIIAYTDNNYSNFIERYFKYSEELNKYCYLSNKYKESYLKYKLNVDTSKKFYFSGMFKPLLKETSNYYTLFTIVNANNNEILKVSYKHPQIYVYYNQTNISNKLPMSYDKFNEFTFYHNGSNYIVKNNDKTMTLNNLNISSQDLYIVIGNDNSNNSFSGLISDVVFGFTSQTSYESQKTSFINLSDEYGRLKNKIIKTNNNSIQLTYSYYDSINQDSTKKLNKLINRVKYYDDSEEIITYDDNDSITKKTLIKNNEVIKVTDYTYDDFNRLIEEVVYEKNNNELTETKKELFYYNNFGNITRRVQYKNKVSVNEVSYTYTNDNTNRLEYYLDEVTNDTYMIDYNNTLYPQSIGDKVLEYQGNRLTRYGDVYFVYDSLGKRIRKIDRRNNTNIITNYIYDNDNLVRQTCNNITIDYIYNNTLLEGLRYNNKEYYYVRDITGCIEKIIDNNKKDMVLYKYTSYGQVEAYINPSLSTSEQTIANILMNNNGFVYKGYYYDVETGWFWLSSRYYSPELCRFISPDDVEYLDSESVNGLNLYCYCKNNPIMYSDPSGNSPTKWWEWALAGVAVAGLIVGSIFTCGTLAGAVLAGAALGAGMSLVTQATSGELNWGQFALDTGVGAITGLIGGSGVSQGLATILGGVVGAGSNFVSQLINLQPGEKISIMEIIFAGAVGAVASYIGGAGARNKAALRGSEGYKSAASKLSRTTQRIFNGTRFNNPTTAQATFTKAMNGLTNAIQMEMSNMFYKAMLSYGVSTIGFSMANGLVNHFGGWAF